nr:RNA-directed DNA polymerase, eukaryota [Tanacetum cinerariifolium]
MILLLIFYSPIVSSPAIVLDDSCIAKRDFSSSLMGKIKDINAMSNLYCILENEGFENVKLSYLGGMWVLMEMDSTKSKEKINNHVGVRSWFSELKLACSLFVTNERIVWISVECLPIPDFDFDQEDNSSSYEESEHDFVRNKSDNFELDNDEEIDHVSDSSCMHDKAKPSNSNASVDPNKSDDPFEIYKILNKKKEPEVTKRDEPQFPPGFTPEAVDEKVMKINSERISHPKIILADNNETASSDKIGNASTPKFKASGSILDVMDELIKMNFMSLNIQGLGNKEKKGWIQELNTKHRISFVAIQETKMEKIDLFLSRRCGSRILNLDKTIDQGRGTNDTVNDRSKLLKELYDLNSFTSFDLAQKAKIRWPIEGDENSKYFHGIINKKRSQMAIRGVLAEGEWVVEPAMVKKEFFNHFSNRFAAPISLKISIQLQFPKRLSLDQNEFLERTATYEEIKKAVWDCGTNKSSGPDGFSFEFFKRYWGIIDQDVVVAVLQFFSTGSFPPGCNSSFIRLISKMQKAKLNTKAMIFKVDFEKAFDSGDLLSLFLFILIMESLHVSFENVLNVGLYKGICLDDSLSLSHMFYADDIVFVGERKMSLIGWKHILASKKNGGLGSSLWFRVVNAFCGNRVAIDIIHNSSRRSLWLDIIREFNSISSIDKSCSVAVKVRDASLIACFRRPPGGGIEVDQLRILRDIISPIVLSNSNYRWLWRLDSARVFFVKSARCYIDESFLPKVEVSTRWIVSIPIKILCPSCYIVVESTMHILFSCDLARQLMRKVTRWWEVEFHNFHSYGDWLLLFKNLRFPKVFKDVFEGVCYVMWWVIWNYRNQVLFGNIIPRIDLFFDEISRLSYSWASSRCKSLSIDWNVWIKNPSSLSL